MVEFFGSGLGFRVGVSGCRALWRTSFRSRARMRIFAGVSMELMMGAQSFQAFWGPRDSNTL